MTGIVKDKETRKALANVNIAVLGSNIGTVTNTDGVFSLKVSQEELSRGVIVSHLGYQNAMVTAETLTNTEKRPTIWLTPTALTLEMVNIYGGDPLALVEKAMAQPIGSAKLSELAVGKNAFAGIRVAVCALITVSVVKLFKSNVKQHWHIALAIIAFVVVALLKLSPVYVVVGCAVLSFIFGKKVQKA